MKRKTPLKQNWTSRNTILIHERHRSFAIGEIFYSEQTTYMDKSCDNLIGELQANSIFNEILNS